MVLQRFIFLLVAIRFLRDRVFTFPLTISLAGSLINWFIHETCPSTISGLVNQLMTQQRNERKVNVIKRQAHGNKQEINYMTNDYSSAVSSSVGNRWVIYYLFCFFPWASFHLVFSLHFLSLGH